MTLMEVVVALAIAGVALAAGATSLGFLADQQRNPGIRSIAAASAARTTLRAWTSQARMTTEGDAEFRGVPAGYTLGGVRAMPLTPSVQLGGAADTNVADGELTFVTAAPTDVATTGTWVHLFVEHDSAGAHGLVAELLPFRGRGAPVRVAIAPGATGLGIRYLGSLAGRRVWQSSWISTSVPPAAVELRVRFDPTASPDQSDVAARSLLALPMLIPLVARR
jgi:hypothetical protein